MRDFLWRSARWLVVGTLCVLAIAAVVRIYLAYGPLVRDLDERLPLLFRAGPAVFWAWMLGSAAVAAFSGIWALRRLRAARRRKPGDDAATEPAGPGFAEARESILALQARRPEVPLYLAFARADEPARLLVSAGLAPASTVDAPAALRGFSTEEGLFVQCGGEVGDAARYACRSIFDPDGPAPPPPLRGIVVLAPFDLLEGPEARPFLASVRAGLRAVAEALPIRCPVFVVITGMEDVEGFLEFARRMPPEYRTMARFGFSMPGGPSPSPAAAIEATHREFDRFVAWYGRTIVGLLARDPLDHPGNEALYSLSLRFLQKRRAILDLLEASSIGPDPDPPDLLGCYFSATGETPDTRAFAEGLIRGKVVGDPNSPRWSLPATLADRSLRRSAFWIGLVALLATILTWLYIWLGLRPDGWLVPTLLVATAIGWSIASYSLLAGRRRVGAG